MKRWFLLFAIAIGVLSAVRAEAQFTPVAGGTVRLSWDSCSPLVMDRATNPGPIQIVASVLGQATAHKAYQVWIAGHSSSFAALPDAWRFDGDGCQAGRASVSSASPPPLAASCPSFVPAGVEKVEFNLVQLAPPGLNLFGEWINGLLLVAYPNSGGVVPDPNVRYHLATFTFDHTFSVPGSASEAGTCGGLEARMCFTAIPGRTSWLDLQDQEWIFNGVGQSGVGEVPFISVNDPHGACNSVIPAQATTWGSIKAQYKR